MSQAYAQKAMIYGQIVNQLTGKPVTNADVFIKGTAINTQSDKKGRFELKGLVKGKTYVVSVFSMGMKSVEKQVLLDVSSLKVDVSMDIYEELLKEISVTDTETTKQIARLNSIEGVGIYDAKKSEVILLDNLTANLATNNSRQVYNKVPGLNIWESDGAGLQLGIGGRGLSPSRTSNFNTRQNGYDIAADALGYPESYYTPPLEAVKKIQLVRGAASLQYGTQFGGMLNFVMKEGNPEKPIEFTTRQTVGSFGLFNSFNSVGGTKGKVNYYAFYQYKEGDGWRPNSDFEAHTAYAAVKYDVTEKLNIGFELTHMNYLSQQPGGLDDSQFEEDPRQSTTNEDWFKVNWNVGALTFKYKFTDKSKVEVKGFGLYAGRDALGRDQRAEVPTAADRLLVADKFRNFGAEAKFMQHYTLKGMSSVFLIGTRYYKGFDEKLQGSVAKDTGSNFNFINADSLRSDHDFNIDNTAVFIENLINVSDKFSITPGVRYEYIGTAGEGTYEVPYYKKNPETGLPEEVMVQTPDAISKYRSIFMAGLGMSFKPNNSHEIYANISQNYRAITFSDLRSLNTKVRVDENMTDEKGYSFDIGARGSGDFYSYDISYFYLRYNNRIGLRFPSNPIRTNIADAYTMGVESFAEINLLHFIGQDIKPRLNLFGNISLIDGRYISDEKAINGNQVELVPPLNLKLGLNFNYNNFSLSTQYSYVDEHFVDAENTATPIAPGVYGPIPAYYVADLSLKYKYKFAMIETGVNNLTDNMYFTRRATGYPGPGIIPSDGRNFYVTLQVKL